MKSIIVYSFMIKVLKLKGSELLVYALIYSFSQFNQDCFMSPEKMAIELGISRSQVFRSLKSLQDKSLILFNFDGYITNNRDCFDGLVKNELDDLIRIAKTPWLDD